MWWDKNMITKIEIDKLLPHEQTREDHIQELLDQITKDGFLMRPIAVFKTNIPGHSEHFIILDGHHRTGCLKRLGCKHIMANVVDIWDPAIKVGCWADLNKELPKEKIIELALSGKDLKPKTTKFIFCSGGQNAPFQDNDLVEPKIFTPLEELK